MNEIIFFQIVIKLICGLTPDAIHKKLPKKNYILSLKEILQISGHNFFPKIYETYNYMDGSNCTFFGF